MCWLIAISPGCIHCRWLSWSTSHWWLSSFSSRTASRYSLCSTRTHRTAGRIFSTRFSIIPISACFRTLSLISASCKVSSYAHCDISTCIFFRCASVCVLSIYCPWWGQGRIMVHPGPEAPKRLRAPRTYICNIGVILVLFLLLPPLFRNVVYVKKTTVFAHAPKQRKLERFLRGTTFKH